MEVTRIRALRGPNLWSRHTSIEAIVRCAPAEMSIDRMARFEVRLRERFPLIGAIRPIGSRDDVPMAQALQFAALRLQAEAGCPVTFSRTVPTRDPGLFQVVFEYTEEPVGRLALQLAEALCVAARDNQPFDLDSALSSLRALDEDIRMGPSTGSIADAARERDIPMRRLTEGSLVQFGWGSRARRIQAAEIDATSAIAESIAQDKELTKKLLAAAGVPVPEGRVVRTADEAWKAMRELASPVVVKPQDGNQGKGVTVNIVSRDHLEVAFGAASEFSSNVMVERFIPGHDHRLLVVGDRLIAAARRDPPHVVGDGVQTIRQLVEEINRDPRRGDGHATSLTKIRLDEIAHARMRVQGYDADSVPPRGARVVLRNNANLSTGGSATDVTDDVHPDLAARAVEAAQMVGLEIAGVDVVCQSVQQTLEEQGGAIVEVNAAPGLRMHISPSFGKGRDVGEAIVRLLYGEADNGRIPVVAVTGTNGKTTTVRLIAHLLAQAGLRVGMTNTDGVYVNGVQTDSGDCAGPRSARNVLMHPEVDAAVFETARGGILREGLGFDRCQVAVVTNIGRGDHLGMNHIDSIDDLALVKRVIVANVAPSGFAVLNAADPITASMQSVCPGHTILFAQDGSLPAMKRHAASGQRTVRTDGGAILAVQGTTVLHRIELARVPLTGSGTIPFQIDNAMAAVAAGWALELDWALIAAGLATFDSDPATVPGRFNRFSFRGATVIADYGHNPDAILALSQAIEAMPARRRSIVISAAGDRRDQDIIEQGEIVGRFFDHVILYQDAAQRGRADGEVLALLRQGLAGASRTTRTDEIRGEFLAIDTALDQLEPGDVCLILIDQVDEALAHLAARTAADAEAVSLKT
jgi:cyanophycin synthetase